MTTPEASPLKKLRNKMYVTRASRFNADKRLRREHKLVHLTLATISAYLIALSAAPAFEVDFLPQDSNYEFLSLLFSALVLGFSSLEIGNDRSREAFFLHQNAMNIDKLWGQIATYDDTTPSNQIQQAYEDYAKIIAECEFNHCLIDTLWHQVWNDWLGFWKRLFSFLGWLVFAFWHYGFYISAIILPLAIPLYLSFPDAAPVTIP